jgi:hypothetical protein
MTEAENAVSIAFTLPASRVTLHEPVYVDFTVANGTAEVIQFDLGYNLTENFMFLITEPGGSVVQSPHLAQEGPGRLGRLMLASHQIYHQRLLINEWYGFGAIGRYVIVVRLPRFIDGAVMSDNLILTVLPRDPQRLEQICDELVNQAKGGDSAAVRMEAARDLSFVCDPIAVSHLKRLAAVSGAVGSHAVRGLARIGNEEALESLNLIARSIDRESGALAEFLLPRSNRAHRGRDVE